MPVHGSFASINKNRAAGVKGPMYGTEDIDAKIRELKDTHKDLL